MPRKIIKTGWLTVAVLICALPSALAVQYARPSGTVSGGSWTATGAPTLHEATDEVTPNDDTDYMVTGTDADIAELTLGSLTDPSSSVDHIIRFRMRTTGSGSKERCEIQLFQGAVLIATTDTQQSRPDYTTFTYTLSSSEADAITNYADLRFKVLSSNMGAGETVVVTWMEFEVPDAGGATVPVLSSPTAAAIDTTSATLGAYIDSDGGDPITSRGTVWNTTGPPITENALDEGGTGLGTFSHSRSPLPSGTQIYFRGYAVNGVGTGYSPDGTFYSEPTQASSVTFPGVSSSSLTVSWTAGGGDGAIVLMKQGAPVDADPVDGTEHVAISVFGNGEELGTGNYVVFRDVGTQVTVTGLTGDTTYHVAVYEYAGSGTLINYQQTDPALGSQLTDPAPAGGHNALNNAECLNCHALHSDPLPRDAAQEAVCKTCHYPLGPASAKSDVALHTADGGATIIDCGSCHDVHNNLTFLTTTDTHPGGGTAQNLAFIRGNTTKYITGALEPALFHNRPGHYAFEETNPPWNGVCQSCHQNTSHHTNDGTGDHAHRMGEDCISCHTHVTGFASSGGGCTDCHSSDQDNEDGPPTRRAVVGEFSLNSHHVAGGAVTDEDCGVCHYEAVDGAYHMDNTVDLRDPDDGTETTLISFTLFTRNTASDVLETWVTDVQNNFCLKCHDLDGATATNVSTNPLQPFSASSGDVPNVFDQFDPANSYHHAIRAAGTNPYCIPSASNGDNITMELPWNQDGTHDLISCFDCHEANGHGDNKQRMLRNPIDLDTMESTVDPANLPVGMGSTVETFCTRCHKASVYVSASDPESVGSIFEYHGVGQNQHGAAGGNELGCMGCHAGIVDFGSLTDPNGAARGNVHGGNFTWPASSNMSGFATEHFMLGGWIGGWDFSGATGYCRGGECNHKNSSKNYTR
ncbi:MAG: hypothetical protein ACYTG7_01395 [Planctomycetota bacterium]